MKILIFIVALIPGFCIGQESIKKQDSNFYKLDLSKKHEIKKSIIEDLTLPKNQNSGVYSFVDIPVKIENGHGDSVEVLFSALIEKEVWYHFILYHDMNERLAFSLIAASLSKKAQAILKNTLSFEPLKRQSFINNGGSFMCTYKLMGRNGYGNLLETSTIVQYDPIYSDNRK